MIIVVIMKQISSGIFKDENRLYTKNLILGKRVYGEKLVDVKDTQLREWDPTRSKLAAAILNGMNINPIKEGSKVLYLGASTGTTPSHISDIVGPKGIVYCLEFAERVFRSVVELQKDRKNIAPILVDARKPEEYSWIEECDIVYVDIAQPDETEISIRNAKEFLKFNGYMLIAIKSRSIDVTKDPKQVYKEEKIKLQESDFEIVDIINLEPYEKDHAMIVCKK
ncbi:MAG: fibrillarin-like rRNA/tRNA 2'-O-methyltransferase [Candidatus Aenigmarchaeota archaeon]|nr:fibrillarin-like rRNA/tRNA 2'-O-methyltransferase [Candidatus Aenigmarchaeota archaeon]